MTDSTPEWVKTAKPGDKVVKIKDGPSPHTSDLQKGKVYTILSVEIGLFEDNYSGAVVGACGLNIKGYTVDSLTGSPIAYYPKYFRPLQSKSTESGMSTLKSILNGSPVIEGMDA